MEAIILIDIHAHNGKFPHSEPMPGNMAYDHRGETMQDFIADLDLDQVDCGFISSAQALLEDLVEGNATTYADAALDSRLFAYTYYDPLRVEESLREIEKYRRHPKFIGFKSRPAFHKICFDHPGYRPLLEASVRLGKPILLHCTPMQDAVAMRDMAALYPAAKLIMVHACKEQYREAVTLVRDRENVFVEPVTSMHFPGKIRTILGIVGSGRLMFGTDYGLLSRSRILHTYEEAQMTPAERESVFAGNAWHVFGLKAELSTTSEEVG